MLVHNFDPAKGGLEIESFWPQGQSHKGPLINIRANKNAHLGATRRTMTHTQTGRMLPHSLSPPARPHSFIHAASASTHVRRINASTISRAAVMFDIRHKADNNPHGSIFRLCSPQGRLHGDDTEKQQRGEKI